MNKNIIRTVISLISVVALSAATAQAEPFDFKDPKGVNNVAFSMDAPLEYISGTANGISGTVEFDAAHPEKTAGSIVLDTSTLMVANAMMRDHMTGEHWMNVQAFPSITFTATGLTGVTQDGQKVSATATGSLTIKGITKEVEIPVSLTYLPGKLGARVQGMEGDILVIRSDFTILRSDYDINAGQNLDKVSDEVLLKLSIAGYHAK